MNQAARKQQLRAQLTAVRDKTLRLFEGVPEEFLKRRVHSFYSPIGWHFGHIGRTEEYWVVSAALKKPVLDEHLTFRFADLEDNPKDDRVNIPDRAQILNYLAATRNRVLEELEMADLDDANRLIADGYGWEFALQHECQHQETIAEMLTLIHKAQGPETVPAPEDFPLWTEGVSHEWVDIPSGVFCMGSENRHGYDNEKSAHTVKVEPFSLAKYPVTAYQWSQFIQADGYLNKNVWSTQGWAWREAGRVTQPEYWVNVGGRFAMLCPSGLRTICPDEPVQSISWYEAEAYANWIGARLPSEEEWEFVAGGDGREYPWGKEAPSQARSANALRGWGPGPVGAHEGVSRHGVHDLGGGVWEWTASPFLPYPGFEAFPYDGYSKDHMEGKHQVCRGGSWATADPILRVTFRNWYVPTYRQGFLGLRLAKNR